MVLFETEVGFGIRLVVLVVVGVNVGVGVLTQVGVKAGN